MILDESIPQLPNDIKPNESIGAGISPKKLASQKAWHVMACVAKIVDKGVVRNFVETGFKPLRNKMNTMINLKRDLDECNTFFCLFCTEPLRASTTPRPT